MSENLRTILRYMLSGQTHSGRGGYSARDMRALERRGLVKQGKVCTWETFWHLTDAGRETAYCDVCSHQWRPGSYDDHLMALRLRRCTKCGGEWYMQTDVCLWCRGESVRPIEA